ncbi:MAG: MucR family transcriptional regulator, partial [Alphaproteobacteria bacterium]
MTENTNSSEMLALTTEIVSSHVANNAVAVNDLPQLIQQVYVTLAAVGKAPSLAAERPQPVVSIKRSVT